MEFSTSKAKCIFLIAVSLFLDAVFAQDRIDMKCNPGIRHRFEVCPKGYCCVRDEFLPTYVYCRKIGLEDDNCTTKDNESECPCATGLDCKPNIASQLLSLYGRCHNASLDSTTSPTTTSTTTTTTTTTTTMDTTQQMVTSDPTTSVPKTTIPVQPRQDPFPVPIVG